MEVLFGDGAAGGGGAILLEGMPAAWRNANISYTERTSAPTQRNEDIVTRQHSTDEIQ